MPVLSSSGFGNYIVKLLAMSAVLCMVYFAMVRLLDFHLDSRAFLFLLVFFIVLSAGMHALLLKISGQRPQQFINAFMGVTGGKLFALLIMLMIYLGLNKNADRVGFILSFFILYVSFTTFEVVILLKTLKNKGNN